jgi:hypothetical protein
MIANWKIQSYQLDSVSVAVAWNTAREQPLLRRVDGNGARLDDPVTTRAMPPMSGHFSPGCAPRLPSPPSVSCSNDSISSWSSPPALPAMASSNSGVPSWVSSPDSTHHRRSRAGGTRHTAVHSDARQIDSNEVVPGTGSRIDIALAILLTLLGRRYFSISATRSQVSSDDFASRALAGTLITGRARIWRTDLRHRVRIGLDHVSAQSQPDGDASAFANAALTPKGWSRARRPVPA